MSGGDEHQGTGSAGEHHDQCGHGVDPPVRRMPGADSAAHVTARRETIRLARARAAAFA